MNLATLIALMFDKPPKPRPQPEFRPLLPAQRVVVRRIYGLDADYPETRRISEQELSEWVRSL